MNPVLVYLAGPIESSPREEDQLWREEVSNYLCSKWTFFSVRDPYLLNKEVGYCPKYLSSLQGQERVNAIREVIKRDINYLSSCDLVICKLNDYISAGTYGELTHAFYKSIPVYAHINYREKKVPSWALGCCTYTFDTMEELLKDFVHREKTAAQYLEHNKEFFCDV